MQLLITNDDGLCARGLHHLWLGLHTLHDVTVVAPDQERSGASASISLSDCASLTKVRHPIYPRCWQLNGTPADCVRLALSEPFGLWPQMVIAGINNGSNAGRNVLYSGTVGAAIAAAHLGLPAIAISCEGRDGCQFETAQHFIPELLAWLESHPLPSGCVLNVNVPASRPVQGVKIASQGRSYWSCRAQLIRADSESTHYQRHSYHEQIEESTHSDVYWLSRGFITLVPLDVDNLTHCEWTRLHQDHATSIKLLPDGRATSLEQERR